MSSLGLVRVSPSSGGRSGNGIAAGTLVGLVVAVGSAVGVSVGGETVLVAGTAVLVGGRGVSVGGRGVSVGAAATDVGDGSTGVAVGWDVPQPATSSNRITTTVAALKCAAMFLFLSPPHAPGTTSLSKNNSS
jgi:hypothetical protein